MKICDILKGGGRTFSFEFFPPKTRADTRQLYQAVKALVPLRPAFLQPYKTQNRTGNRGASHLHFTLKARNKSHNKKTAQAERKQYPCAQGRYSDNQGGGIASL